MKAKCKDCGLIDRPVGKFIITYFGLKSKSLFLLLQN